jgi:hypothetical protein
MNFTDEEIKQYMNKEDLLVPKLEDILDDANVENKVEEEDKTNKTTKNILKDDKIKEINSFEDYLF